MKLSTLRKPLENDKGGILIIALLMLIILTLLGIAATDTTNVEIQVAANEKIYKEAFYNADSGIFYAVAKGSILVPSHGAAPSFTQVTPPDLPSNVNLYYRDVTAGPPRQIEVRSVGTAKGGGTASIVAGIEFVTAGKQQGPGNLSSY